MFLKQLSSDRLIIGAPAKINLFLQVLNKRDDGYHNINSLFQAVSLFDRLTITKNRDIDTARLTVQNNPELHKEPDNLVCRAFQLMADRFDLKGGLVISLEKNIPVAAGLAGGSSDAAATIMAINQLFELDLTNPEMADLGLGLGSDIPFFFSAGQALVTGRGEIIKETNFARNYWLELITPDLSISTTQAYAELSLTLTKPKNPFSLRGSEAVEELLFSLSEVQNDFEEAHLRSFPVLARIKEGLLERGAALARMSGSGPTVFGIYLDAPSTMSEGNEGRSDCQVSVVRPVVLPGRLS